MGSVLNTRVLGHPGNWLTAALVLALFIVVANLGRKD